MVKFEIFLMLVFVKFILKHYLNTKNFNLFLNAGIKAELKVYKMKIGVLIKTYNIL